MMAMSLRSTAAGTILLLVAVGTAAAPTLAAAPPLPPSAPPPQSPFEAVTSFAVVTSAATSRRFFGPGMPAEYAYHVPPIPAMLSGYLAQGQTLGFVDAAALAAASPSDLVRRHKLVVLPETTGVSDEAGATLLGFARQGGAVIVSGGALLYGADGAAFGSFASPLGKALGLTHAGAISSAADVGGFNVSQTSNPEWWRLLTLPDRPLSADGQMQRVAPSVPGKSVLVLATASLAGGSSVPLVTAVQVGKRGWLVYCAASNYQLIQSAANFVFAATGVYLNPGAGGNAGHAPMSLKAGNSSRAASKTTAVLVYRPPARPADSLEGTFRITVISPPNRSACVQLLDNWWGDSPPSHTITNISSHADIAVTVQVSYAGTVACATVSSNPAQTPWFELRTAANGALHGFCRSEMDCELNGRERGISILDAAHFD
jgi:hypothetical protein